MFIYESTFSFFFILVVFITGITFFRVIGSSFSFVKSYLFGLLLVALVNPALFYLSNFFYIENNGYELNKNYADLFFAGDFLYLLLLGGLVATRSTNILKRHLYLSLGSTTILTISLLVFVLNETDSFRHVVICMSLLILLVSIIFECMRSFSRLTYGRSVLSFTLICSFVSSCFWLTMLFLIISFESLDKIPYPMTQTLLNFWLILKALFIFLFFCFFDFIDDEERQIFSETLVRNANERTEQMTLAYTSLFKLPYPVLVIALDGVIEFSNSECIKLLGATDLDSKNINSVFLTIEPSSSNSSLCSIKLADKSLRMYKIKYFSIDLKKTNKKLCCVENIDFDFSAFCQGVVSKGDSVPNKISGILDHNFAIYRMSSEWTELLNPIDKFFHSGIIWDKLKILSMDKREIFHLENSIDSSSESTAWLNLRSGSSIKVSITKLYAPDFRHFYLFSADIVYNRLDSNNLTNFVTSHKYKTT